MEMVLTSDCLYLHLSWESSRVPARGGGLSAWYGAQRDCMVSPGDGGGDVSTPAYFPGYWTAIIMITTHTYTHTLMS